MNTQILSKNELVINAEEEKGEEEEGRKKEKNTRMDMVNTEKRKEKQEVQLLNYQQIPLPCLRNKTKQKRGKKINENNREKSKSRKVNRNSACLCTF